MLKPPIKDMNLYIRKCLICNYKMDISKDKYISNPYKGIKSISWPDGILNNILHFKKRHNKNLICPSCDRDIKIKSIF